MPGRQFDGSSLKYRYGFNGKENDNEVKGEGSQQDYGMRIYDPRLGKFLSVDPKYKIFLFQTPYAFSANNPIRFIEVNGEGPGLNLKDLNNNPKFTGLTINDLRSMIRTTNPKLENFKVNISAGHLLENAYAEFSNLPRNKERLVSSVSLWGIPIKLRFILPDHIQATQFTDEKGTTTTFPYGGYYEVTATHQIITENIKDKQIEAYFNKLPWATNNMSDTYAGSVKSAQLTLVVPYGTAVDPDLIKKATKKGINLYISYAFRNIETGAIVFSNPERLNPRMNKEFRYTDIGNIDKPAVPDAKKAASIWRDTDNLSKNTNEVEGQNY